MIRAYSKALTGLKIPNGKATGGGLLFVPRAVTAMRLSVTKPKVVGKRKLPYEELGVIGGSSLRNCSPNILLHPEPPILLAIT